jgi:hypothetical protein
MFLKENRKEIFRPKCNPNFQSVHCIAHLKSDVSEVLPYLNERSKSCRGHDRPRERRKRKMAGEQKKTQEEFQSCCQGMPFAEMMRKMIESKKSGSPFNCAEMMSQMMQKCCETKKEKEEATLKSKKNPVPKP